MANIKIILLFLLVSLLAIGITAILARYLREINVTRAHLASLGSQVIDTPCGPIEYARAGSGYPVLVVHGAMGGFDAGLQVAQPAIDAGYQVIAVSRFGYLRTPLPADTSLNKQADAYACLLDALGIQQAAVWGISAGATSSIRFTARYPQRVSALILTSPAAPGKVKVANPPRALFDGLLRNDFAYWVFVTYFQPMMQKVIGVPDSYALTPQTDAEVKATLATTLLASQRMDGFIAETFGDSTEFYAELSDDGPYPLKKVETPVLVLNTLDDPLAVPENVRGLVEKFPNGRLVVFPDGGHILLGRSDELKAEVTGFLHSHVAVLAGIL